MNRILLSLLLFSYFVFNNAKAQSNEPKLIEEVKSVTNEFINIPFKKYVYPNGLTLIVTEDHTNPLVYVDVTYKVGSSRELPGQSGFAHFFEHLMFEGTKNLSKPEFYKLFPESYSNFNGATNTDFTKYHELIPKNYIETALWMESDRMMNIGNSITQEKLNLQRKIVINEKYEKDLNVPYGIIDELVNLKLFPKNHPYSWPIIGYMKDLKAATIDDMKFFFYKWYCPNNAIITISGDVKSDEVVQYVTKYFSLIPKGEEIEKMKKFDKSLLKDEDKLIEYEDNVRYHLNRKVYQTVPAWHQDEAPLDALSYVFNQMTNIKSGTKKYSIPSNIDVSHPCKELTGIFEIDCWSGCVNINETILLGFKSIQKSGLDAEDLAEFKEFKKKNFYTVLEDITSKGLQLSSYEFYNNSPNGIKKDWERYAQISTVNLQQVFDTYINGKFAVILNVKPFQVSKDAYKDRSTKLADSSILNLKNDFIEKRISLINNLTSFPKPIIKEKNNTSASNYWTSTFTNNIKLIGTNNNNSPITYIQLRLKAGAAFYPKKPGIPNILAGLLNVGITDNNNKIDTKNSLKKLGSNISFYVTDDDLICNISCMNDKFDITMDIFKEIVENVNVKNESIINSLVMQSYGMFKQNISVSSSIAKVIFYQKLYPKTHVMHYPYSGSSKSLIGITSLDLEDYFNNYVSTKDAKIIALSNLDKSKIEEKFKFLTQWKSKSNIPAYIPCELPFVNEISIYNIEDAAQADIIVGSKGLRKNDTGDYFKIQLLNYVLGGSMNGRMNTSLREKYGYTYNVNSKFIGSTYLDVFKCVTSVKPENADSVILFIVRMIKDMKENGITDEEYKMIKEQFAEADMLDAYNNDNRFSYISDLIECDFDNSILDKQKNILQNITKQELNELAAKYLYPENLQIVVVGNLEKLEPRLEKLDFRLNFCKILE